MATTYLEHACRRLLDCTLAQFVEALPEDTRRALHRAWITSELALTERVAEAIARALRVDTTLLREIAALDEVRIGSGTSERHPVGKRSRRKMTTREPISKGDVLTDESGSWRAVYVGSPDADGARFVRLARVQ